MAPRKKNPSRNGAPIDSQGWPAMDPTANVISILAEAVRRQDDLREKDASHIKEIADLRATFDDKLRKAESARIDAIRAVDVGAVNRAAEVSTAEAQTLAQQVATSAETLRAQVTAAATAATVALAAALEPIQKDVQDLRRIQYEQQGQKAGVVETKTDARSDSSRIWQVAAVLATYITVVAGILIALLHH